MSLREAAEMALHCLETSRVFVTSRERIKRPEGEDFYDEAINALRDALAEAEKAEPVAFDDDEVLFVFDAAMTGRHWWSGGAWLYPGDSVVVRRVPSTARRTVRHMRSAATMIDLDELDRLKNSAYRWQYTEKLLESAPELIAMARRYQWLRGDRLPEHSVRWMQWEVRCWEAPEWTADLRHDRLDAAIDAAMQEQQP